ncbi:hypothetical protein [Sphingomonas glaciei]|uniref:Uncharacterized protein n=1 Tax=Sphingomonas glaciei TaxID=2938948 RepID=A0ABY5MY24_9SPHN|nr:hypothetical protein [Sphingomonas glaciei]UUR09354.1 hypothetical protein M1K48_07010 [Sphingomonas glaciei]
MRSFEKQAIALIFIASVATASPAIARPVAGGTSCIGFGASFTQGAGILEALAMLGGMLFGTEIAATHCDPSFE